MNQINGIKRSKVVFCSIAALVLGLLTPIAVLFQLMMPMAGISVAMIAAAVLYGCSGIVPVAVMAAASAISGLCLFGISGALMLLSWGIPAAVMIVGMRRREAFFQQMARGVAAAVLAAAIAMAGMAVLFGSDLVAICIDEMRAIFDAQKSSMWQMLEPMMGEGVNFEDFVQTYYTALNTLQIYYEYYLVANQLSGAVFSAAIAVLWGNWKLARRGEATAQSYCSPSKWYLPANTTWGLLMMLVLGFIVAHTSMSAAQSTWIIVSELCSSAFFIQFMAAMWRRMSRSGAGHIARGALMGLVVMLASAWGLVDYLAILGGISALFGSKGAAKPMIDKLKKKIDGEGR